MTEYLVEALIALTLFLGAATAWLKRQHTVRAVLDERLEQLETEHGVTRSRVTKLEGYRNGYQNGRKSS
jgi:hypothetical protein